jgi:glutamate formiminotransferase/formiminotetrahydrofolate cyclodeaminase
MSRFADLTLSAFLDQLANSEPTPGGGTASAIAGAMGTSLLIMVTGLPKSKTGSDGERAALANARTVLTPIRARLTDLGDADSEAFNQVMAAYRLPKGTDEEKAARTAAIQRALWGATEIPLETLRACADAIESARVVARCGNSSAASDVGVAVRLLEAGAAGAEANVRINLEGLRDQALRARAAADASRLLAQANAAGAAAFTLLTA